MNALDGIIAITVLIMGFGIILSGISSANNSFTKSNDALIAKTMAIACASNIDSMYSNSANLIEQEIKCIPNEFTQTATYNNATKESQTTTKTAKEFSIEVNILDHYLD